MRYGMVIDLRRCIGCNSCTIACKQQNGTPAGVFYSHVNIYETGKYPEAKLQAQPVLCNHCADAPCVDVCPTGATQKLENGIVTVDETKCIGCRYCMVVCPYNARTFYYSKPQGYYPDKGLTTFEEVKVPGAHRRYGGEVRFLRRSPCQRRAARLCPDLPGEGSHLRRLGRSQQ